MPTLVEKTNVSYHNVMKLVQVLTKADIVETIQGKYGGVVLKQCLDDFSLKDVIELMEGPVMLSDCFHADCYCQFMPGCQIKSVLGTVQSDILNVLENTKIKSMVEEVK